MWLRGGRWPQKGTAKGAKKTEKRLEDVKFAFFGAMRHMGAPTKPAIRKRNDHGNPGEPEVIKRVKSGLAMVRFSAIGLPSLREVASQKDAPNDMNVVMKGLWWTRKPCKRQ